MGRKCNGCDAVIYDISYMECARDGCNKLYHLKCLALTKDKYEAFTEEYKCNWRCPECVCSAPKRDNSDTPVRGNQNIMNQTSTPCYVNSDRGNRMFPKEVIELDISSKILQELQEFRFEMNFKIDEQIREYNLLKDRFVDTETELRKLRDTMKVVQKKASKVDELEAQIKTLEQKNEQLKNCLNKNQPTKERNETVKEIRKETLSFAKVLTQNEKQVLSKNQPVNKDNNKDKRVVACVAMKPTCNIETAAESFDKEQLSTDNTENKMETSKKKRSWITVQKKKYPERQVLRGGNTGTGNIQGTERKKFLHVWRLKKDITVESLEGHVKNICGKETEITVEKIKHKTERDYASFIIGVPESSYEILCKPECWAVNIEFCEWVWFRKPPNK